MIKLKDIVNEDYVEDIFGKIAFGGPKVTEEDDFLDYRDLEKVKKILQLQGKTEWDMEENTPIEMEIIRTLQDWTYNATADRARILYSHLNHIKVATEKFPVVFKPITSDGAQLYRGYKNRDIQNQLVNTDKTDYKTITVDNAVYWKYNKPIQYKPTNLVQSWTSNKDVSNRFTGGFAILLTKQNDEFFFSQKLLKILREGLYEAETLHFGKEYKNDVYVAISDFVYTKMFEETET